MRWLLRILGGLLIVVGGLLALAFGTEYRPAPTEPAVTTCDGGRTLQAGEAFNLVSWNIQYAATRKHHFFYDGGTVGKVPASDVEEGLRRIQNQLQLLEPDLILFQEIDRGADRTAGIDQQKALQGMLGMPCSLSAPYWRAPFVPTPSGDMLGRTEMHLGQLAKVQMQNGERVQLALLRESRFKQIFNIKRALLTSELPIQGWSAPLALAQTHLSAFSNGDGTLEAQVAVLEQWMSARPPDQPWILAGDLNLLPPGDDASRLGADAAHYADATNPIERLLPRFHEIFGDAQLAPQNRTFLPFGATETDRKIDFVFYGGPLEVCEARVVQEPDPVSDHLPIYARFVLPELGAVPGADGVPAPTPGGCRVPLERYLNEDGSWKSPAEIR